MRPFVFCGQVSSPPKTLSTQPNPIHPLPLPPRYEKEGKFLTKKNTFLDFCACAEHLVKSRLTAPDRLAISGASAGGLLIGASVNMRPELFKCALADVPFTDVAVTMCDASIPLTVVEWEEWGE